VVLQALGRKAYGLSPRADRFNYRRRQKSERDHMPYVAIERSRRMRMPELCGESITPAISIRFCALTLSWSNVRFALARFNQLKGEICRHRRTRRGRPFLSVARSLRLLLLLAVTLVSTPAWGTNNNPLLGAAPGAPPKGLNVLINTSAPPGAHLTYYGGRVVSSMQVVQVLWGSSGSYLPQVSLPINPVWPPSTKRC
jgi:hypothetical protein